jgi:hypothetical protein
MQLIVFLTTKADSNRDPRVATDQGVVPNRADVEAHLDRLVSTTLESTYHKLLFVISKISYVTVYLLKMNFSLGHICSTVTDRISYWCG